VANFNRYLTAVEIINGAAVESGLQAITDPFSSTDPSFLSLAQLLNSCGRELITAHPWQQLRREASITFNYGGASTAALPDSFDRMLDQTMWNRTDLWPVGGPLNPQEWQGLKGSNVSLIPTKVSFRLDQDLIKVYPDVPATGTNPYATVYYEYISRAWVLTDASVERDYLSASTDTVRYDSLMMIKFLKLRFLGAKGFDTTDAGNQMERAFDAAISKQNPGRVLSVAPSYGRDLDTSMTYPRQLG
jgi:hypothetical protein